MSPAPIITRLTLLTTKRRRILAGIFFTLVCLFGISGAELRGQTPAIGQFEGRTIVSIQYSPGTFLHPADLDAAQPLHTGQPLGAASVANAIDSLFATGQFDDIAVEAEPSGSGVALHFVVKPRVFIQNVEVSGSIKAPPNSAQLRSFSELRIGDPFQESDIAPAVKRLSQLLVSNGLYHGDVTSHTRLSAAGDQAFIDFRVVSGKRAKYTWPEIQGASLLPDSVIVRVSGWRLPIINWWRQVTEARTNQGAHRILSRYQNQDHLAASVNVTGLDYNVATNRAAPQLSITPGPRIQIKAVEAKVSRRVLKRYVPVFDQRAVDTDLLLEGKRNLQDYFQSQGFYDVTVDFRVKPVVNGLQTIEYVISKGTRRKVVRVAVKGNRYFDTETIRERMFIQPASFTLRHGRYSDVFRRRDEENISALYQQNGFRDVRVTITVESPFNQNADQISVTVHIEEGPQWLVNEVTIDGAGQLDLKEIRPTLASSSGQPFSEVNLATDRRLILRYYFEHGFPSADLRASWKPAGTSRADVLYRITEGERQYVRDVLVSGVRATNQKLLSNYITLKPGDPLSAVEQTRIQQNLYNLGVFASVDTAIQNPDGTAAHKYVLYSLEEANRYQMRVGVGAQIGLWGTPSSTSLANPGGRAGFSPQFAFDLTRLNFLGLGHTISLRTAYSSLDKRAAVTYLQPFRNREERHITYSLLYENQLDIRTFASKREQASVQLSQQFSRSLTGQFGITYSRVSVSDVIIPVLLIPQFLQPVRLGILTTSLAQDRRNNPVNPSHGIFNTLDFGLATKVLGSGRSFGRVLLRNATYYQLTKSLILARQTQFGVIAPFGVPAGFTSFSYVPLPEHFFAGGDNSLRAFPWNQAGPRDTGAPLVPGGPSSAPTGFPLGGNALLINNVELRFPLIGQNIQGVLFHDMGNVYSTLSAISFRFHQRNLTDFDYAVHAVGFGLRYRTPVGPIRVDLAYSINPPSYNGFGGTPYQLLQCNPNLPPTQVPSYCTPSHQMISHIQFFFSIGQTF